MESDLGVSLSDVPGTMLDFSVSTVSSARPSSAANASGTAISSAATSAAAEVSSLPMSTEPTSGIFGRQAGHFELPTTGPPAANPTGTSTHFMTQTCLSMDVAQPTALARMLHMLQIHAPEMLSSTAQDAISALATAGFMPGTVTSTTMAPASHVTAAPPSGVTGGAGLLHNPMGSHQPRPWFTNYGLTMSPPSIPFSLNALGGHSVSLSAPVLPLSVPMHLNPLSYPGLRAENDPLTIPLPTSALVSAGGTSFRHDVDIFNAAANLLTLSRDGVMSQLQHTTPGSMQATWLGMSAANMERNAESKYQRPKKGVERKYTGTNDTTWKEFSNTELAAFFMLHRVPEAEQGLFAYLALGPTPKAYIDAVLAAPSDQVQHMAWMQHKFAQPGGLQTLNDAMNGNPLYGDKETVLTKLQKLRTLIIQRDAADLEEQFAEHSRLLSELRAQMPISSHEELMLLFQMISPCNYLYDRVRVNRDHQNWLDGVPLDQHAAVVAKVHQEMFRLHYENVQRRTEKAQLQNLVLHAGQGNNKKRGAGAVATRYAQAANTKRQQREQGQQSQPSTSAQPTQQPAPSAKKQKQSQPQTQQREKKTAKKHTFTPEQYAAIKWRQANGRCFFCGGDDHRKDDRDKCSSPGVYTNIERDAAQAAAGKGNSPGKGRGVGKGKGSKAKK